MTIIQIKQDPGERHILVLGNSEVIRHDLDRAKKEPTTHGSFPLQTVAFDALLSLSKNVRPFKVSLLYAGTRDPFEFERYLGLFSSARGGWNGPSSLSLSDWPLDKVGYEEAKLADLLLLKIERHCSRLLQDENLVLRVRELMSKAPITAMYGSDVGYAYDSTITDNTPDGQMREVQGLGLIKGRSHVIRGLTDQGDKRGIASRLATHSNMPDSHTQRIGPNDVLLYSGQNSRPINLDYQDGLVLSRHPDNSFIRAANAVRHYAAAPAITSVTADRPRLPGRHAIAIGGGISNWDNRNDPNHEYIGRVAEYFLVGTGLQKLIPHPRICYLGTAMGDRPELGVSFKKRMEELGCQVDIIPFFGEGVDHNFSPDSLSDYDVIYMGGGTTASRIAVWEQWGISEGLRKAARDGVILIGSSDGMLALYKKGSSGVVPVMVKGLGILPGSAAPHFEEPSRESGCHDLMKENLVSLMRGNKLSKREDLLDPFCIGIPSLTMVHYVDGIPMRIWHPPHVERKVFLLELINGKVKSTQLHGSVLTDEVLQYLRENDDDPVRPPSRVGLRVRHEFFTDPSYIKWRNAEAMEVNRHFTPEDRVSIAAHGELTRFDQSL